MNQTRLKKVKRGSVLRCLFPLLLYMAVETLISFLVIMVYYRSKGLLANSYATLEELYIALMKALSDNYSVVNYATMGLTYGTLIPLFYLLYRRDRAMNRGLGFESLPEKVPAKHYGILLPAGAAFCLAGSFMIDLSGLSEASTSYQESVKVLLGGEAAAEFLILGLMAPIAEELLFRGMIYKRLLERNKLIPAMLASSFVFASMHGNLVQGLYGFFAGLFLVYIYERFGSLKACILFHVSSNVIALIGSNTDYLDFMVKDTMTTYISTLLLSVLVFLTFYYVEVMVRPYTDKQVMEEN